MPKPAVACEHLRLIGPLVLSALPSGIIPREDGFDAVGPSTVIQTISAQRVIVTNDSLALAGSTQLVEKRDGVQDVQAPVPARDGMATIYGVSDEQDLTHSRFALFDSSYARKSDIEFDDGHDLCTWGHLVCSDTRCFAGCSSKDGPRFAAFDAMTGALVSGPDDGGFSLHGGDGTTVPLSCGSNIPIATSFGTYARVDARTYLVDNEPSCCGGAFALPWPYDWSSLVWLSQDWTFKRLEPASGGVTVVGQDGFDEAEILADWRATNIGLVRVSGAATTKEVTTADTKLRAHVMRSDGTITADLEFDADGYVTEWTSAALPTGLAFAWHEQHNGTPNVDKVAVISCADGS